MIRHFAVFVLFFTSICGVALAQSAALDTTPPSRAQILQLLSAMGVQKNIDASLQNTQKNMKLAARTSFQKKNPDADAVTLKKLDEVFDSTPLFNFEVITDVLVPVYQKNLSAADVQAGIDFYTSGAGKRLLEKIPVINRESSESGGKLVQQKLNAYSEELDRKLEAFQAEANRQKPAVPPSTTAAGQSKPADDKSKDTVEKSK